MLEVRLMLGVSVVFVPCCCSGWRSPLCGAAAKTPAESVFHHWWESQWCAATSGGPRERYEYTHTYTHTHTHTKTHTLKVQLCFCGWQSNATSRSRVQAFLRVGSVSAFICCAVKPRWLWMKPSVNLTALQLKNSYTKQRPTGQSCRLALLDALCSVNHLSNKVHLESSESSLGVGFLSCWFVC